MTLPCPSPGLPVEDVLPALMAALEAEGVAVLTAPPGAGDGARCADGGRTCPRTGRQPQ